MAIIFLLTITTYAASLAALVMEKKANGLFKKALRLGNWIALSLTLILITFWTFNLHLSALSLEIIPFWAFIFSAIALFGLTDLTKKEKAFYGFFFFGHLFLTVILIIPFIGIGLTYLVYYPFLTNKATYEDNRLIVVDEAIGILAAKPSPTIYLKHGLLARKYQTNAYPVCKVDSIWLDNNTDTTQITIHDGPVQMTIHLKK
jgi:hypothetical protein